MTNRPDVEAAGT